MNEIDILINSIFNQTGLAQAQTALERFKAGYDFSSMSRQTDMFNHKLQSVGFSFDKNIDRFRNSKGQFAAAFDIGRAVKAFDMETKSMLKGMDKLTTKATTLRRNFSMEFLGVMFFGMMLQRAFMNLAKTTVGSFMKITEGMTPAAQAVNALQANMELLKFTIGGAIAGVLEALLPILIPIITAIADWTEQHPKLVGWLIVLGIVLGATMFMIGQLHLGFEAIANAAVNLYKGLELTAMQWGSWTVLLEAVIGWILIAAVIIAVLYAAWKTNLGGIQDFTRESFGILMQLFSTVFGGIVQIVGTAFDIIVAIFSGDWGKVWELTKKLGNQIFELLLKILADLSALAYNIVAWLLNTIKDIAMSLAKLFVDLLKISDDIFTNISVTIKNVFLTAINFVITKLNELISRLADIEVMGAKPFAWLNNLKMQTKPLIDLNEELAKNQQQKENAMQALDNFSQTITLDYITSDQVKQMNQFIEEHNKFNQQLEDTNQVTSPKSSWSESFNAQLEKLNGLMEAVPDQAANVEKTSQSMIEQNNNETESWDMKNQAISEHISLLKELASIQAQGGGSSSSIDLERYLGNYATSKGNL